MDLKKHYKELYSKHGDDSKAVQYSDIQSQNKRFEILTEISIEIFSVVDVGCGLSHMYNYLLSKGFKG